jgi:GH15 family glucan-1,4-alpha-glucosidase
VDPLARTGRVEDAVRLMDELVGLAKEVGLYADETEPTTGAFPGNTPQARSHLEPISAALAHAEEMGR